MFFNYLRISYILGMCWLLTATTLFAQENFSVTRINPSLLKDADAVLRTDETVFEIVSVSEAKKHHRAVVTIFNDKAEDKYGQIAVGYDKFTKISDITGAIYDAEGKLVRKLKSSDIQDYGYGNSGDEITDARIKLADFGKKSHPYPYTIELSYDTRLRNMMFYPAWQPTGDAQTAVEIAVYKIKAPAGFKFRYKEYNGAPAMVQSKDAAGFDIYQWTMKDQPAYKPDSYPLPDLDFNPMVLTAPSDFEVQDYKGNFNSWEDLSTFYYTLNAGRDVLSPAILAEIKEVVKPAKSDREKVVLLYKWMQSRSRYVSIQLGIGGWQTMDAAFVGSKGYGDCKALSNFTVAALKQVGIVAHVALIKAGEEAEMKTDFPSSQFNHVVACTILGKDTLWLECTSQTTVPNYMGTFTGNRQALLVMPKGGKLVDMPHYYSAQNGRARRTKVELDENGTGQVEVFTTYTGLQQESRNNLIHSYSNDEQKRWLLNHLNVPSADLQRFEISEGKGSIPLVTEKLSLSVRNCATKSGTRLFVKPNLLTKTMELPATTDARTSDFYLSEMDYNLTDLDTVSLKIPDGFKLETTLPSAQFESGFGSYETKVSFEDNKLLCARKLVLKGGRYPSKDYQSWIDFLKKIRKADRVQIVFVENK